MFPGVHIYNLRENRKKKKPFLRVLFLEGAQKTFCHLKVCRTFTKNIFFFEKRIIFLKFSADCIAPWDTQRGKKEFSYKNARAEDI